MHKLRSQQIYVIFDFDDMLDLHIWFLSRLYRINDVYTVSCRVVLRNFWSECCNGCLSNRLLFCYIGSDMFELPGW